MTMAWTGVKKPSGSATLNKWGARIFAAAIASCMIAGSPECKADETSAYEVRYSEHVRPILSERCFLCHGPDHSSRQADLRLDIFEGATADRGGYAAVAPGDPDASELWRRVTSDNPAVQMPPPAAGSHQLTSDEQGILRRWIEGGAKYEKHWSYIPPTKPAVPTVQNESWCHNDLDHFVLAKLELHTIAPSPAARKETLLRRLFLDLTGLPPTPQQIDAFIANQDEGAYEQWVERLLNEEPFKTRYAEHWASTWLDAARYSDTIGLHTDNGRQNWLWREWLIDALRDNMPYDQFVTEQLAGDLIDGATTAQKVASGFNRNHVATDEGGAIAEEYLIEYAVDRTNTTSSVFLGLTMGCARCHDHKYDPITQVEFYEFLSFFNSIEEPGLYSQTPNAQRAYEPFLAVPTEEQETAIAQLEARIEELKLEMTQRPPGEDEERVASVAAAKEQSNVQWDTPAVVKASSSDTRVTLTVEDDGSIQAAGPNPATESYSIILKAPASQADRRLLLLEALATPGAGPGSGRAFHGNVVISGITLEQQIAGEAEERWQPIAFRWAWSDHTQTNLDYEVTNLLRKEKTLGWAADGNTRAGERNLCFLTDEPFGTEQDSLLRVTIDFKSIYAGHSAGRVRLRTGTLDDNGLATLPPAMGRWYVAGQFPSKDAGAVYDTVHGPELQKSLDIAETFGPDKRTYRYDAALVDSKPVALASGIGSQYLARVVFSPDERIVPVSLGSDDGFRLFVNGEEVAGKSTNRGVAANQDQATIPLRAGRNILVFKIVNTGGQGGYYFRAIEPDGVLQHDLVAMLLPPDSMNEEQDGRLADAWRRTVSPAYRLAKENLAATTQELQTVRSSIPQTMIMKEREEKRETFVLLRGEYDKPDKTRPVTPGVPAILGQLDEQMPQNRLGLARWMMAPENPLVARVAVNRIVQNLLGLGLVSSSDDFGLQGVWPEHRELLDWLAVEFRENDWDVQHIIREVVTSNTYKQRSHIRTDLEDVDPDNLLLARYPRRRMSAEQIRDLALFTSGLLDERKGGASVKTYQPPGLWREVSMVASNTRDFKLGGADELWRRSLYTYWKRASPPPSLLMLDAPTREACVVRRRITNTPLQALVLWNDVQFVEAARMLAQRTLADDGDDNSRLSTMFLRCTGRRPSNDDVKKLNDALNTFRDRYGEAPEDAEAILGVGMAPATEDHPASELAAWTVIASAILNLHETLTQD